MDEEDMLPRPKKAASLQPLQLKELSIEELEEYIEQLEAEIERVRADIEAKKSHLGAAAALFKS
ncbi:MAG: DUF1192 domain-containing protein [Alphaproteobacteria bacterium]|nr:DUF1192 domain-containing protein [Alphaproteobacteria bacterium]